MNLGSLCSNQGENYLIIVSMKTVKLNLDFQRFILSLKVMLAI